MIYNPQPPYEILQNKLIDFASMQNLRRFARYWDLIANSGNFVETTPLIWGAGTASSPHSPFRAFMRFSQWLHAQAGRTDSIALVRLMELFFEYLISELKLDPARVAQPLWRDYCRGGRPDKPSFLKPFLPASSQSTAASTRPDLPKRQARHLSKT